MTKNTQAAMADAQTKAQAADLQAAEYQKVRTHLLAHPVWYLIRASIVTEASSLLASRSFLRTLRCGDNSALAAEQYLMESVGACPVRDEGCLGLPNDGSIYGTHRRCRGCPGSSRRWMKAAPR